MQTIFDPEISEWGNPLTFIREYDVLKFKIGTSGEPPELKHLSRARKRHQHEIPLVVASERGRGQTESRNTFGVWTSISIIIVSRSVWESTPKNVRAM